MDHDELPESVEEAGALLGAAILGYGRNGVEIPPPPKGMHSSFSAMSPVPSTDLFTRLHALRALLRNAPQDEPLLSAPSLIEGVLVKLLGVSSSVASAIASSASSVSSSSLGSSNSSASSKQRTIPVPPMLSRPLRKLWVDCVVLCHKLGDGISGAGAPRVNLFAFCRNMMALASTNPRSGRAAGGTRVAAFEALESLLREPKLASQLSSWAFDIIALAQRSLKSLGNGEPGFRLAAVRTACAATVACRISSQKLRPIDSGVDPQRLMLRENAMEDKAIAETVKLLRLAVTDKFPEVRRAAASLAALVAPMAVLANNNRSQSGSDPSSFSPTASLEEIMSAAMKNMDDESPDVSAGWAEALARCICTGIEYCSRLQAQNTSRRDVEGGADGSGDANGGASTAEPTAAAAAASALSNRFAAARKMVQTTSICTNISVAMEFVVNQFVKAGGERMAPKSGGTFSVGGRAVRLGYTRCLIHLLRLQSSMQTIGEGRGISIKEALAVILNLVGPDMEAQLHAVDKTQSAGVSLDATSVAEQASTREPAVSAPAALFGQAPKKAHADAGIARMSANRVLRDGLSAISSESMQLTIFHELVHLSSDENRRSVNGDQLQVVLIELSHLVVTLGEAVSSSIEEISPALIGCLGHPTHGVRHEAAVACAALSAVFPAVGRDSIKSSVSKIQMEHAELMAHTSANPDSQSQDSGAGRLLRFRRSPVKEVVKTDDSLKHQYLIHGHSLMCSMLSRDLPHLPGGISSELLASQLSVAEVLVSTLLNNVMSGGNPRATCTSVRAGFSIICGALTCGPDAVAPHIALIFGLWQKCNKHKPSGKFTDSHDLLCTDALLSSIVAFLKNCSELLLSIPDALSRTSILLEDLLPQFMPRGRLGKAQSNPVAASRLLSAKASLMESFAWLPPGSFPMVADDVFEFAALHIRTSIESNITCSIIQSMVNTEDGLLDAKTFSSASVPGQVGGAKDLEQDIIYLTAEPAHHSDRESVFFLINSSSRAKLKNEGDVKFHASRVLGSYISEQKTRPPTPLHEVGTWRTPVDPSCSCKVRLLDAAIQVFSATFGLKSGKDQQKAIQMLQSFAPTVSTQTSRAIGAAEQDRRAKQAREDSASVANIIAVILSCLKALPLHESTHNVPIGLGPAWMNRGKDLLLDLLPFASLVARRAAAEALAMFATVGGSEDARFLQSSVLHSLDEVIQANQHDGKQKQVPLESISAARAGSFLTLACIQRTAFAIQKIKSDRSRGRGTPVSEIKDAEQLNEIPTFQMMTRVFPSITCYGPKDFFGVRTYALHAFSLLLAYSNKISKEKIDVESLQLLKKAVELIEDNFMTAWAPALADLDRGNEREKMSFEASFLAVLLRSATFVSPFLHHLKSSDSQIASRFSHMASMVLECCGSHPAVICEAMALFETIGSERKLLPKPSAKISYADCPLLSAIPFIEKCLLPHRPAIEPEGRWLGNQGCMESNIATIATLQATKGLLLARVRLSSWGGMKTISCVYAALELACSARCFSGETVHRSLAAPRRSEYVYGMGHSALCSEKLCVDILPVFLQLESQIFPAEGSAFLQLILLARVLVMGAGAKSSGDDEEDAPNHYSVENVTNTANRTAASNAALVLVASNPVRWQVKAQAVQMANLALISIVKHRQQNVSSSLDFDPKLARAACKQECETASDSSGSLPSSRIAFHLSEIITAACAASAATVEQTEMRLLQEGAVYMLKQLIFAFGSVSDPEQKENSILDEFIPQLSSSIKQALALEQNGGEMSYRMYLAGCETLGAFVSSQVTSDRAVLKRLSRGTLPSSGEISVMGTSIPNSKTSLDEKTGISALEIIGKMWVVSNVISVDESLVIDMGVDPLSLGSTLASLAFDGVRILAHSELSTCGATSEASVKLPERKSGYWYNDINDIHPSLQFALASKWSAFARAAIHFLIQVKDNDEQSTGRAWLQKMVPITMLGVRDAVSALAGLSSCHPSASWANGMDSNLVLSNCIASLTAMISAPENTQFDDQFFASCDELVAMLNVSIIQPLLTSRRKIEESKDDEGDIGLSSRCLPNPFTFLKTCEMFRALSASKSSASSEGSALLSALLMPLQKVQSGELDLSVSQNAQLLSTCLSSLASVVEQSKTSDKLLRVMMSFIVQFISGDAYIVVKDSARLLLEACIQTGSLSNDDVSEIAFKMAKSHNWEAWSIVCASGDISAPAKSLSVVSGILADSAQPQKQMLAVVAVKELIQSSAVSTEGIQQIVLSVSAEILGILQVYGSTKVEGADASKKTAIVSDCMKIVLVCYQNVTSGSADEKIILGFLVVMFETFISIIRYNGLPNHPRPQPDSNPALGRLCAQAIVHAARTTPAHFKSSLAVVPDNSRAVLEFAVRADMSGYAAPATQARQKKTISLKGFKK